MSPTARSQRIARWLGVCFSAAVIGVNVFTANCGLGEPPTASDIGLEKPSANIIVATKATTPAILKLLAGNSFVITTAGGSVCAAFDGTPAGETSSCHVRSRTTEGTVSQAAAGSCAIDVTGGTDAAAAKTYELRFRKPIDGYNATLATIKSSVDFDQIQADHPNGSGLDGYVVTDADVATITLTFHAGNAYCADSFAADDGY